LLDLDMVRPFHAFPTPEKGNLKNEMESGNLYGFVESPRYHTNIPKGPPMGLAKEFGADPFTYVKDIEKFQPEWTPGATEESRLNKQLADTIAHEGRHKLFNEPRFDKILDMLNTSDLGGVGKKYLEEEFTRYLGLPYNEHLGLSRTDLYQNPLLYKFFQSDRPGQGKFTEDQLVNLFWKMTKAYRKETRPRAGPQAARPPKKKYVSSPRGGGADVMHVPPPRRTVTPRHAPHPDRGGYEQSGGAQGTPSDQPGGQVGGLGGHGPARWAYGGRIDKALEGRSRDI